MKLKFPSRRTLINVAMLSLAAGVVYAQAYNPLTSDFFKVYSGVGGTYHDVQLSNIPLNLCANGGAPSVTSGFGTNAVVVNVNNSCDFSMATGSTAASNGVIALPQAPFNWICQPQDITTNSNAMFSTKMTNSTANSVTLDSFQANGAVGNWVANDTLVVECSPI